MSGTVRSWLAPLAALVVVAGLLYLAIRQSGHVAAAPTVAETARAPAGHETATFAAGCFWSMEAIFKQLRGVDKVEPGYAGGRAPNPSYEEVETGQTGYA